MKKIIVYLLIFICVFSFPSQIYAQNSNNKFGIHILDETDINDAAILVNSNGGDWGYVTVVIRADEKNQKRWQEFFDTLRAKHLIPIVRIATIQTNSHWRKPEISDIPSWVSFFNSLNWVTKDRYVIVGNEPNHDKEWGGEANPKEYAEYLYEFSKALNESNSDYVVMPAGFDASAPNDNNHMDEADYLSWMLIHKPNVFEYIEAWSSHSYPNPGFSGKPTDTGRKSIRTYEWELEYLKSLGVTKNLPIFITETGWAHDMGESKNGYLPIETINAYLKESYEKVWSDEKIVAVTPFILRYTGEPFEIFSWKDESGNYYPFFGTIQSIPKEKGIPLQISAGEIVERLVPPVVENGSKKYGVGLFRNTGQSIWERKKYMDIDVSGKVINISPVNPFLDILPNETGIVLYSEGNVDVLGMQISSIFDTILQPIRRLGVRD